MANELKLKRLEDSEGFREIVVQNLDELHEGDVILAAKYVGSTDLNRFCSPLLYLGRNYRRPDAGMTFVGRSAGNTHIRIMDLRAPISIGEEGELVYDSSSLNQYLEGDLNYLPLDFLLKKFEI